MPTPPRNAPRSGACTRAGASSYPIPGTSAPRGICKTMGFKALATTSAGFAWSRGFADGGVPRDMMLAHIAELSAAADVPMNADFEGGYAHEPVGVAESVRLCVATGVSGLSIEDYTGDMAKPLYDFDMAVARMRAARAGDRQGRRRRAAHRPQRGLHPQSRRTWPRPSAASRLTRTPAPIASMRRASRRARRSPPWSRRVAPKPVNFLMGGAERAHRARPHRARRAPHQRRRCAGALGLGRLHAHGRRRSPAPAASRASPMRRRAPTSSRDCAAERPNNHCVSSAPNTSSTTPASPSR